ncbi:MAG TPA: multidrug effflux MFS transporter [Dermatophilaceae bacterium]|nr:multidrug effflux MFS transporter [Dermatophilaceae bacterium]HOA02647.1 multidrug effflux MFS transporter [Dermatophilaceae bacterium]HOF35449.1 multidrug effflux MFS transporter [Dermatophilaceae bacterium]HOI03101.1 multidrug effflux MFS transporter [Dermatophilaceae bacterium]HOR15602.1 multidrug effflux MFS transporter [Dermatophilaceae bacterium]
MIVRRASDRGIVVLLAALTMLGPFTVDTIFPGFPAVQREFTVDAVATQQIVSVYLFTFAVMSLLHGPLSDALGRRPVIVGGLAMFTVTSVLCALAPSMTWLLVGRALQGVFAGGGMIVGRTVVRDVFSGHPAQRAMSQMSMIFGVAPALAPIVGGWLLGWSSWRSIFWFLAIFAVVVLAAVMLLLPETHPPTRRTPLSTRALVSAVTDSSKDPSVRRLLLVSSFNFAALFTYISAAPAFIVDHLHLGPGDFGWLFVPVVTMMIVGSWLTGRLAGRISGPRFLTLGFGVAVLGGVVQLALDVVGLRTLPWVLVGPVTTGLGIALVFPIVTLVLLEVRPRHRGTLSSMQSFSNTMLNAIVAGALVPLVSASLAGLTGAAVTFSIAGWLVWARHHRMAHPDVSAPPDPESYEPTDRM